MNHQHQRHCAIASVTLHRRLEPTCPFIVSPARRPAATEFWFLFPERGGKGETFLGSEAISQDFKGFFFNVVKCQSKSPHKDRSTAMCVLVDNQGGSNVPCFPHKHLYTNPSFFPNLLPLTFTTRISPLNYLSWIRSCWLLEAERLSRHSSARHHFPASWGL